MRALFSAVLTDMSLAVPHFMPDQAWLEFRVRPAVCMPSNCCCRCHVLLLLPTYKHCLTTPHTPLTCADCSLLHQVPAFYPWLKHNLDT